MESFSNLQLPPTDIAKAEEELNRYVFGDVRFFIHVQCSFSIPQETHQNLPRTIHLRLHIPLLALVAMELIVQFLGAQVKPISRVTSGEAFMGQE